MAIPSVTPGSMPQDLAAFFSQGPLPGVAPSPAPAPIDAVPPPTGPGTSPVAPPTQMPDWAQDFVSRLTPMGAVQGQVQDTTQLSPEETQFLQTPQSQGPAPSPAGQGDTSTPQPPDPSQVFGQQLDSIGPVGTAKTSRQAAMRAGQLGDVQVGANAAARQNLQDAELAENQAILDGIDKVNEQTMLSQAQKQRERVQIRQTAALKLAESDARAEEAANAEPNPQRLWANTSGWGKAAAWVSTMAFAFAGRNEPGMANPMLAKLDAMINQDIQIQKETLENKRVRIKEGRANIIMERSDQLADAEDDYAMRNVRITGLERKLQQAAKNAGGDAKRLAGINQTLAELAGMRKSGQEKEMSRLEGIETQGRAFAQQTRMAKVQEDYKIAEEGRAAARAKAAADAKGAEEANKDTFAISPQLGLSIVTSRDGDKNLTVVDPAKARLDKKIYMEATQTVSKAQELHTTLARMEKILQTTTNFDELVKPDAEYNQLVQQAGRLLATNPNFNKGVTSEGDVRDATKVFSGIREGGWLANAYNVGDRRDMAMKAVAQYRGNLPNSVNQQLKAFPTPEGGSLHWTPKDAPEEAMTDTEYQLPGEKDRRIAATIANDSGQEVPGSVTRLAPMSPAEVKTAKAVESQTAGMTTRGQLEFMRGKLESKDAQSRYVQKNEKALDKTRELEDKALNAVLKGATMETVGRGEQGQPLFKLVPPEDPTNAQLIKEMVRVGFNKSKIAPADIAYMRKKMAERIEGAVPPQNRAPAAPPVGPSPYWLGPNGQSPLTSAPADIPFKSR